MDDLVAQLAGVQLSNSVLVFQPSQIIRNRLPHRGLTDDRYLYRSFDHNSDGRTDDTQATSRDAWHCQSSQDIFEWDHRAAAAMLFRHLKWHADYCMPDNMVSWTSSLLFALKYAFYRAAKHGTRLEDIKLCIVDTTKFPAGTFMRDLDLIAAFAPFDTLLANFAGLRRRQHRQYSGMYYFGEYLSQGSLGLENKCGIVNISQLVNAGLFTVLPRLFLSRYGSMGWANEVIRLREDWYIHEANTDMLPETTQPELQAARNISDLFEARWKLPVALAMLSLRPRRDRDYRIAQTFTAPVASCKFILSPKHPN